VQRTLTPGGPRSTITCFHGQWETMSNEHAIGDAPKVADDHQLYNGGRNKVSVDHVTHWYR